MTDFRTWPQTSLAQFAKEAQAELLEQEVVIKDLREQLKVALTEVRRLIVKAG